jgi:hypothetical protein
MPRYFFHIYHDMTQPDLEGEELPDMHAAWKEATVTAGKTIQNMKAGPRLADASNR